MTWKRQGWWFLSCSTHLTDLTCAENTCALKWLVEYHKFHQEVNSLTNELFASTISNVILLLGKKSTYLLMPMIYLLTWPILFPDTYSPLRFFYFHLTRPAIRFHCPPQWYVSFLCHNLVHYLLCSQDSLLCHHTDKIIVDIAIEQEIAMTLSGVSKLQPLATGVLEELWIWPNTCNWKYYSATSKHWTPLWGVLLSQLQIKGWKTIQQKSTSLGY